MDEITLLKAENDRLNKIIGILIDQVGILKEQNTNLLDIIRQNNLDYPVAGKVNTPPNDWNTIAGKVNARPNDWSTIAEKGNAPPNNGSTIAEKVNAPPNDDSTIAEKGNAPPNDWNIIAEKVKASPDIGSTIAGKVNASASDGNTPAGKGIHPVEINMSSKGKLARALEKYYHVSIKRMALDSIALQLLLLYNRGRTHRTELRKISGLSAPGFAKAVPKLVKRGMIKKVSYQEYEISQLSADIIAKLFPA